jgi:hypothetical protein
MDSASGSTNITTEEPTEDGGFWVTYTAQDNAGNRAKAFRQVSVVCPSGERICKANLGTRRTCSVNGKCVDMSLAAAVTGTGVAGTGVNQVLCLFKLQAGGRLKALA